MKNVSQDFIDSEEAIQREPAELFHIWRNDDSQHWYLTSGDAPLTYDGNEYSPGTLKRGQVTYNSTLDVSIVQVDAPSLLDPVVEYIAQNPIEIMWISIAKIHRQDLTEVDIIFVGQIKEINFKGIHGACQCVGFEHFLKKSIPLWRYQLTCNHAVFDSKCALTKASYAVNTIISLDITKKELISSAFGMFDDGYFIGGEIVFGNESRSIIAHEGNTVYLMYPFIELETADIVDAYPGCDGRATTCRDTFDNIDNYLGFPFIPIENPAIRVSW